MFYLKCDITRKFDTQWWEKHEQQLQQCKQCRSKQDQAQAFWLHKQHKKQKQLLRRKAELKMYDLKMIVDSISEIWYEMIVDLIFW